jgi:putative spermidine/putrescine transport system ATP-binding protein/spermidine/putrescine transport system ATP-binding protein
MPHIVELDRVSKSFAGGVTAVDDVSLAVEEGEFVTLLGPSGCGKTTTLRMIGGFDLPTQGMIRLAGEDVTHLPPYQRQVNMVFQDYALFPHMSVGRNVAYGLERMKLPREEIDKIVRSTLQQVELAEVIDRKPHQLSGGQRQRVALARAIARKPKVLLLDEPLSALDANLREQMQVELKHLHDRLGLTFILVTHNQTEALVMSDRVVVMEAGRVAQVGTPDEIYDKPASPYVANFIGTSNLIEMTVDAVSDGCIDLKRGGLSLKARPQGRTAAVGQLLLAGVRPEKAMLVGSAAEAPAGMSVLTGSVQEVLFHGSNARIRVELAGGSPFLIDLPLGSTHARLALPRRGEPVAIAVHPDNVTLFRAERA